MPANSASPPGIPPIGNVNLLPQPVSIALPAFDATQISYETNYIQTVLAASEAAKASAAENCASYAAQASLYGSQVDFAASTYSAATSYNASTYGSDQQLRGVMYSSDTDAQSRAGVAQIDAIAQVQAAGIDAAARVAAAGIDISTRIAEAETDANARVAAAQIESQASLGAAQIDYDAKVYTASANKDAQVFSAQQDFGARAYAADQSLAAATTEANASLAVAQTHEQAESARQTERITYAEDKYSALWPVVQGFLLDDNIDTPGLADANGNQAPFPYVSLAGVLTERQIQQQVNSALARNDSRTQAAILNAQTELAGRGFSSNSPLLQAMTTGYLGQNLRANCDAETQIRVQAAQANADQILKATQVAVNATQAQQGVLIDSEKNKITRQVGLMGALAQLVGGLS